MKRSIMLLVCVLLAVALLATVGCQFSKEVDPGTGDKKETLGVNPKTADTIVGGLETAGKVVGVAFDITPYNCKKDTYGNLVTVENIAGRMTWWVPKVQT